MTACAWRCPDLLYVLRCCAGLALGELAEATVNGWRERLLSFLATWVRLFMRMPSTLLTGCTGLVRFFATFGARSLRLGEAGLTGFRFTGSFFTGDRRAGFFWVPTWARLPLRYTFPLLSATRRFCFAA